ncbi:MAG: transposase domain-containing protein [Desulfobacterales bacterium]
MAQACAAFFTLIETVKANSLEPYGYLRHVFKKFPLVQTEQDLNDLLPQNIHPDDIAVTAQD